MKVLLRNFNNEKYVWKDAEMHPDYVSYFLVDGATVDQSKVVSIVDDNRRKYVICSHCGAIVRNTPKAIRDHKARGTCSSTCFNCGSLRVTEKFQRGAKYTLQEDGKYLIATKQTAKLTCRNSYYSSYDINSDEARQHCRYKGCITAEMKPVTDVFTQSPGLFDDIITVDKILEDGYKDRREVYGMTYYTLKSRSHIEAVVNNLNIVEHFVIKLRNSIHNVVYSNKTNQLYWFGGSQYERVYRIDGMSNETLENIKAKIANLYK